MAEPNKPSLLFSYMALFKTKKEKEAVAPVSVSAKAEEKEAEKGGETCEHGLNP